MFYDLNFWKSQCEQWAVIIHRDFPRDTVSFRTGEALYIEANAAANAWIDQLRFDLDAAPGIYSDHYQKALSDAQRSSEAFLKFAHELPVEKSRGLIAAAVSESITGLVTAGLQIRERYVAADQLKRTQIKDVLEKYKWRSFRQLATEAKQ